MLSTVVVPLDTSSFGEHAISLARTIACAGPREHLPSVHLVHVHVPVYHTGVGDAFTRPLPLLDDRVDTECRRNEAQYLRTLSTRLHTATGLDVAGTVLDGPVASAIAQHAAQINADLIVMTTHGRGGAARMWLGNVTDALLRHGGVPVVVVRPPSTPPTLEPVPPITRILIPLDGSPLGEQVLKPACALGDRFGASYQLLHVFTTFPSGGYAPGVDAATLQEIEQRERAALQAYLHDVAERLRAEGRRVDVEVCSDEQPARAIRETAHQRGADVVALATHGRSGVRRWLLGSVADKLIRAADMPVLVYHPQTHEYPAP